MYDHPLRKTLPPSLRKLGLALVRGNWKTIASAVMRSLEIRSCVIEMVMMELQYEASHLCEKAKFRSLLRNSTPSDVIEFKWSDLINEWKREAPLLSSFLFAIAGTQRTRNVRKATTIERRFPAMCMAGAILLKERNQEMAALQHLVGIILSHGEIHP